MDEKPDQAYMDRNTGVIHYAKDVPDGDWQVGIAGDRETLSEIIDPATEMSLCLPTLASSNRRTLKLWPISRTAQMPRRNSP